MAVIYVCEGCTYNKGRSIWPGIILCALADLEGNGPEVHAKRPYPCGYVNPCRRYIGTRKIWYQIVG